MSLVIDASVAVKWYFPEAFAEESQALLSQGKRFLAPDLLLTQVSTVLWRRVRTNLITHEEAQRVLRNLRALPLHLVPSDRLLPDALEIATLTTRTLTESIYFALALRERAPLVTADRRWYGLVTTGPMKPYLKFVSDVRSSE
jgi:predicted nucleic acid-binding protein